MTGIQAEIVAALSPGDEHPDPEGIATDLCAHCTFPVVQRRVRTGKEFFGPFWRDAWVHTDTGDAKCWTTTATPDRKVK